VVPQLKDTRKALEEDVAREEDFNKCIADLRSQLLSSKADVPVDPGLYSLSSSSSSSSSSVI